MIPFNRNVNKVDVTLHFEGPCAVIPDRCVSLWSHGVGAHGHVTPRHWFDWLLIMMIDNANSDGLVAVR
jgi:hypothetical protein